VCVCVCVRVCVRVCVCVCVCVFVITHTHTHTHTLSLSLSIFLSCNTLQCPKILDWEEKIPQHTTRNSHTLKFTAIDCNALQYTATHTAMHCKKNTTVPRTNKSKCENLCTYCIVHVSCTLYITIHARTHYILYYFHFTQYLLYTLVVCNFVHTLICVHVYERVSALPNMREWVVYITLAVESLKHGDTPRGDTPRGKQDFLPFLSTRCLSLALSLFLTLSHTRTHTHSINRPLFHFSSQSLSCSLSSLFLGEGRGVWGVVGLTKWVWYDILASRVLDMFDCVEWSRRLNGADV